MVLRDDHSVASSRLRFVAAQLAYKPGARVQRARVLDSADLPGDGWDRMDQRTLRVGFLSRGEPWADDARAHRLVGVWRSFVQHESERYLQVAVTPVTRPDHVRAAMESMSRNRGIRNRAAQVVFVARNDLPAPAGLPEGCPAAASEEVVRGKAYGELTNLRLLLGVESDIVTIAASSARTPWQWADIVAIASDQTSRLRRT